MCPYYPVRSTGCSGQECPAARLLCFVKLGWIHIIVTLSDSFNLFQILLPFNFYQEYQLRWPDINIEYPQCLRRTGVCFQKNTTSGLCLFNSWPFLNNYFHYKNKLLYSLQKQISAFWLNTKCMMNIIKLPSTWVWQMYFVLLIKLI